jgi:hypothetical protein
MTRLFLILLICISSLANAQTSKQRLEDIEDKLDLMRAEQDYKDAQRRIEQQNRGSSETPLQSYIKNRFTKIFSNANVSIYIHDKSISNHGTKDNPSIFFGFLYEFQKPNYTNDGKPYFIVEGTGSIFCKKNFVWINDYHFQDKNLNAFARSGLQTFKTKGTLEEEIQKYLCR